MKVSLKHFMGIAPRGEAPHPDPESCWGHPRSSPDRLADGGGVRPGAIVIERMRCPRCEAVNLGRTEVGEFIDLENSLEPWVDARVQHGGDVKEEALLAPGEWDAIFLPGENILAYGGRYKFVTHTFGALMGVHNVRGSIFLAQ